MLTPELAILYLTTILRPDHVCGVECHARGARTDVSNPPWQVLAELGGEPKLRSGTCVEQQ
jgi:hypothetical protein